MGEGPSPWEKFTDVFKSKPYQWNFPFPPSKGYGKDPHFFFFLEYRIMYNTRNFTGDMPKTTLWQ